MRIVEAMGIPVAHTSFHIFDGVPAIISERYDRIVSANGTVTALHQEDFTQALGIPSSLPDSICKRNACVRAGCLRL